MEIAGIASTFFVVLIVAAAAAACVAIISRKHFQAKLRKVQQEASWRAEQHRLLQNETRRLELEFLKLRVDLASAEQQCRQAENERDHLAAKACQLEAERLGLHETLQRVGQKDREAEEERKRSQDELHYLKSALAGLQESLLNMQRERNRAEEERHSLEEEVRQLKVERERFQETLHNTEEQFRRAQEQSRYLEEKVRQIEKAQQELHAGGKQRNNANEDTAPKIADEQPRTKEQGTQTGEVTNRAEPVERGGAPRGTRQHHETQPAHQPRSPRLKPELTCRKRERQWVPMAEVPEELLQDPGLHVLQGTSTLVRDEYGEGLWPLVDANIQVAVRWQDDETLREVIIKAGENNYLLFKLSGQDQEHGRRVKLPSFGSYLVIVPAEWERHEVLSGPPFAAPESTSLPRYLAHFFILEKDSDLQIAFHAPGGQDVVLHSRGARFQLIGKRLDDAMEYMGPLFGGGPPRICALDEHVWNGVGTVVVGEEGRQTKGWRTEFSPSSEGREQELASVVSSRTGGRYFVRIYDTHDDLVDSLDFRFLADLTDIRVYPHAALPDSKGHLPVRVEFVHNANCFVRSVGEPAGSLQIERDHDRTSVIIPADPAWDLTYWQVESTQGSKVPVEILVERVWWSLGEEGAPLTQTHWSDRSVRVSYNSFRATSQESIWLYLPRPRWARRVLVGFGQSSSRAYQPKVNERTVSIALRDFGYADELRSRTQSASLKVWLDRNGILEGGIGICEVVEESQGVIPVPLVAGVDPTQMRCCTTCDHARRKNNVVWCRRNHWPAVPDDGFKDEFSRFLCGEWRGEYYDFRGEYHRA